MEGQIDLRFYNQIKHSFCQKYFEEAYKNTSKLLNRSFDMKNSSCSGLNEKLIALQNDENSRLIYLPTHRCILDGVLLGKLMVERFNRYARTIGEQKLVIPGITKNAFFMKALMIDFKKCGVISLDRKRFSNKSYCNTFDYYLKEVIETKKEDILFFPEGGRSYDGKLRELKKGLLTVVKQFSDDSSQDYFVVPISMNYESVPEDSRFSMHLKLKNEYIKNLFRIYDMVKTMHGFKKRAKGVFHIDFAKPIRLENRMLVKELRSEVKEGLLRNVRIYPSSLLAMCMKGKTDHASILKNMEKAPSSVNNKHSLEVIEKYSSLEEIADRALHMFNSGRLKATIKKSGNQYKAVNKGTLSYYARLVEHLFIS